MNLNQLAKVMPKMYESNIPIHIQSGPGLGKSSVIRQSIPMLSEIYGEPFALVEFFLTSVDAPDIGGFTVPHKNEDGSAVSIRTKPSFINLIERTMKETGAKRGILFLDEFLQADHLVQKAVAPLLLDGIAGDYKLPEGWYVVGASNRTKDRAGAGKILTHVINRVRTLEIEPHMDSWVKWAEAQGLHPMGIAFAKSFPGVVFTDEIPKDTRPFCTPRSFVAAMEYLAREAGVDADGTPVMELPSDGITQEIVAGSIGQAAGAELMAFLKVANILPTKEELLNNPEKVKLPPGDRLDAQFALSQLLVHIAEAANVDTLFKVVLRLTKELQTSTVRSLIQKSGGVLLNSTPLNDWISKNRALITASMEE